MAHFAKLIVGETYHVQNVLFVKNRAVEVEESLALYLSNNSQFEVILDDSEQNDGGNEDNDNENDEDNDENGQDEEQDEEKQEDDPLNREELLAEAVALGLSFGKRTSTKNLAKLVEEAKAEKGEE